MTDQRNIMRCTKCGVEIYTEASSRYCYKCDGEMKIIGIIKNGKEILA